MTTYCCPFYSKETRIAPHGRGQDRSHHSAGQTSEMIGQHAVKLQVSTWVNNFITNIHISRLQETLPHVPHPLTHLPVRAAAAAARSLQRGRKPCQTSWSEGGNSLVTLFPAGNTTCFHHRLTTDKKTTKYSITDGKLSALHYPRTTY